MCIYNPPIKKSTPIVQSGFKSHPISKACEYTNERAVLPRHLTTNCANCLPEKCDLFKNNRSNALSQMNWMPLDPLHLLQTCLLHTHIN